MIKTANLACGFDTIPTFFGSEYAYAQTLGILTQQNKKATEQRIRSMNEASEAINAFCRKSPEISFTIAFAGQISYGEANPTFNLVSNAESSSTRMKEFAAGLQRDVTFIDLHSENATEYSENYFSTDHHWNITGAYLAYKEIMRQAYPELQQEFDANFVEYQKPTFYGSCSRSGLHLPKTGDLISDFLVDMQNTQIKIDGKNSSLEDVEHVRKYSTGTYQKDFFYTRYSEYFYEGNKSKVEYLGQNETGRNILIIGDSYKKPCEHFFAKSFDNVIAIDQRYNKEQLDDIIKEHNATDILVLASPSKLDYGTNLLTNRWNTM